MSYFMGLSIHLATLYTAVRLLGYPCIHRIGYVVVLCNYWINVNGNVLWYADKLGRVFLFGRKGYVSIVYHIITRIS